jgi:hypothetical protein
MGKLGFIAFLFSIVLFVIYIVFVFLLLFQLISSIKERFKNKSRLITIGIVALVLLLIALKPQGVIDFEKLEGRDLLVAQLDGGNSTITLKLKDNHRFKYRRVCFGIDDVTGDYIIKGDTIFFKNASLSIDEKDFYEFAIIIFSKHTQNKSDAALIIYDDKKDTIGRRLFILKNELYKK